MNTRPDSRTTTSPTALPTLPAVDAELSARLATLRERVADPKAAPVSILMVCLGNICRSPTADGVLRHMVHGAGLDDRIRVDSAGTSDDHAGCPPDERAQQHARRRGYELGALRARRLSAQDFADFDLVLVMDAQNLRNARARCPDPALLPKLARLAQFAAAHPGVTEVPDPYYGGAEGFEEVLDLVEDACGTLLQLLAPGSAGRLTADPGTAPDRPSRG